MELGFRDVFLIFLVVAIIVTVYFLITAPEGFEDKDGFHYKEEKKDDN